VPGLTGQMFAQFALVIAATALISAINAATLKPTQCALWLRPAVPPEKRNVFFRGFNKVYGKLEDAYAGLIGTISWTRWFVLMSVPYLALISLAAAAIAVFLGAGIVRAHDVAATVRAVRVADALREARA